VAISEAFCLNAGPQQAADTPRVAIVHIGKTAGSWLRSAIQENFAPSEICTFLFEYQFDDEHDAIRRYRFFSGHFGYELASKLDASLITVLRNPFDRLVSLYYYWREIPEIDNGHGLAKRLAIEDFLTIRGNWHVDMNLQNAQTWQIAFGTQDASRELGASMSQAELLARAIDNLDKFAVVGVTESMELVCRDVEERIGLKVDRTLARENATRERPKISEISIDLRDRMYPLVNLDLALYEHVLRRNVITRTSP
jgi:hypothetical protein